MKVYGLWCGGSSYSAPEVERDTEEFDSIQEAKGTFQRRYDNDDYPATPCVSDESEMHLFFSDPREMDDPYPDRVLRFGPRGGVIMDAA
jgi:hypothetical protein